MPFVVTFFNAGESQLAEARTVGGKSSKIPYGRSPTGPKTFPKLLADTSAKELVPADPTRLGILIINNGPDTAYLGNDATVTAATGFPLVPGAVLIDNCSGDAWWAITAAGTADLRTVNVE